MERYRFGPHLVDADAFRLQRDGVPVAIQPKSLELLISLLRQRGHLVPRERLDAALWPDTVVSANALRQLLFKTRAALGDAAGIEIESVPRQGLRLVGEVAVECSVPPPPARSERDLFVGRGRELRWLEEVLATTRALTVAGLGGMGKTRLVLHFVHQTRERWDGVWFVDGSACGNAADLEVAVGRALDVPLDGAPGQVRRALAGRGRCLLVVDGLDGLPSIEEPAGTWLDAAPDLRLLVTSRRAAGVRGGAVLPLGPLDADAAAALFRTRARAAVGPDADADDPDGVARLVRALDGVPLGIELAAARAASGASALAERLERGSDPDRRFEAVLDWAWSTCSPEEREALSQLAVFPGPFTLDAAEAVVRVAGSTVDRLTALAATALVRSLGGGWFALLAPVRGWAAARRVDPGTERRFAQWAATFGSERARDALEVHGCVERYRQRSRDLDAILAAARWAIDAGEADLAAGCVLAAAPVLDRVGPQAESVALHERALALGPSPPEEEPLLVKLAEYRLTAGRGDEAAALLDRASALPTARAVPIAIQRVRLALLRGATHGEARLELEAAMVRAIRPSDRYRAERMFGTFDFQAGRTDEAVRRVEGALALATREGDRFFRVALLDRLALFALTLGRTAEAERWYAELEPLLEELGDRNLQCDMRINRAAIAMIGGRLEEWADLSRRVAQVAGALGDRSAEAIALGNLGLNPLVPPDEARRALNEALSILRSIDHRYPQGLFLVGLARLDGSEARFDEAVAASAPFPEPHWSCRLRRAGFLLDHGRTADAAADLAAARALNPLGFEAALLEALTARHALATGDHDRARAALDEARAHVVRQGISLDRTEVGEQIRKVRALLADAP
ncbi:MAG: winged helix-turn-helix domain-containing protein [Myxococcota bacterium]